MVSVFNKPSTPLRVTNLNLKVKVNLYFYLSRSFSLPLIVQEHVLRLEIAVDNAALVQMLEGLDGTGGIELQVRVFTVQFLAVVERKNLASQACLKQEIDAAVDVVRAVELGDEPGIISGGFVEW
jgi:hypothetical protein